MKCTECKYYNGTVQATHSDYHICMKPKYNGFDSWCWVSSKVEKCKDYEPKEEWYDAIAECIDVIDIAVSVSK